MGIYKCATVQITLNGKSIKDSLYGYFSVPLGFLQVDFAY